MAHSEIKLKTTSGSIIYGNAWVVDEDSGRWVKLQAPVPMRFQLPAMLQALLQEECR